VLATSKLLSPSAQHCSPACDWSSWPFANAVLIGLRQHSIGRAQYANALRQSASQLPRCDARHAQHSPIHSPRRTPNLAVRGQPQRRRAGRNEQSRSLVPPQSFSAYRGRPLNSLATTWLQHSASLTLLPRTQLSLGERLTPAAMQCSQPCRLRSELRLRHQSQE
jgi:hypothetical protein